MPDKESSEETERKDKLVDRSVNKNMVIDLAESRRKIDEIDKEIIRLFQERMDVANDVAAYKRSTGKKVYDPQRENEKIAAMRKMANNEFNETAVEDLFRQIMSISRKYQYQKLGPGVNHRETGCQRRHQSCLFWGKRSLYRAGDVGIFWG